MKKNDDKSLDDLVIPVWYKFKPRWYRHLKTVADECGLSMEGVLIAGVKLVLKEHREQKAAAARGSTQSAHKIGAELVRQRWEKTPKEERSKFGREMARKRWNKNQNPNRAA